MRWPNLLNIPNNHHQQIDINGKVIDVMWTDSAELALTTRNKPLFLELVLDFSCFVKKKLTFTEEMSREDITMVNERLGIHFHSIVSGQHRA